MIKNNQFFLLKCATFVKLDHQNIISLQWQQSDIYSYILKSKMIKSTFYQISKALCMALIGGGGLLKNLNISQSFLYKSL